MRFTRQREASGWGLAGVLAAATLLAIGAQAAIGAPADKTARRDAQKAEAEKRAKDAAAAAATTKPNPAPAASPSRVVIRQVGNVTVAVDPATGKVRQPTQEEMAAQLNHMLQRESEDLPTTTLPNGTVVVDLQDTFQEVAMAYIDRHGNLTLSCVHDAETARQILAGKGPDAANGKSYGRRDPGKKGSGKAAERAYRNSLEKE